MSAASLDTTLDTELSRGVHETGSTPVTRIPFARLMSVELSKMFDTRSGLWLMVSIAASALIATTAVILVAPAEALTYDTFGAAVGIPIAVLLPIVAILSVTSEYTQRSGLTTFTLVPHRGRVIGAKLATSVLVGVAGIGVALAIGALGNLVGSAVGGVDTVWDISATQMATLVLANILNMLIGFMLGVLIRNSPGAIVAYFVYSFVLSALSMTLAAFQSWWETGRDWLDFNWAQGPLYDGPMSGAEWVHLATSGLLWLVVPLIVGLVLVMRSEVK